MSGQYFTVGKIVNTHGIKGELKILPHTDFPDVRFVKGNQLFLFLSKEAPHSALTIESSRLHKNVYIIKFVGLEHINDVEKYKGAVLKVSEEDRLDLPEGEYYYNDIMGCEVITDEGEALGVITEILSPGANDVWTITPPDGKEILIPVIDDVVLDVDVKAKKVKIHLMEGLR